MDYLPLVALLLVLFVIALPRFVRILRLLLCDETEFPTEFHDLELIAERRSDMADILRYSVGLPTTTSPDAASKVLVITEVKEGTTDPVVVDVEVPLHDAVAEFEVSQGSSVTLQVKIVDDGGNEALSDTFSFVALDTLPPTVEGGFSNLTLLSERAGEVEPEPTPTPTPEEPAGEEPAGEGEVTA